MLSKTYYLAKLPANRRVIKMPHKRTMSQRGIIRYVNCTFQLVECDSLGLLLGECNHSGEVVEELSLSEELEHEEDVCLGLEHIVEFDWNGDTTHRHQFSDIIYTQIGREFSAHHNNLGQDVVLKTVNKTGCSKTLGTIRTMDSLITIWTT